jgi:hypothetical protein
VKHPLFLADFNETWILSTDIRETLKYQIPYKFIQWLPSHSVKTDMTKLMVAFRNFANARNRDNTNEIICEGVPEFCKRVNM